MLNFQYEFIYFQILNKTCYTNPFIKSTFFIIIEFVTLQWSPMVVLGPITEFFIPHFSPTVTFSPIKQSGFILVVEKGDI